MKRILVVVLLSACSTPPPSASPGSLLPERRGTTPVAPDELTVERAVALAREMHPALAEARALIEASLGRAEQAGAWPNPRVEVRGESMSADTQWVAGAGIDLPVGGRTASARRAEEAEAAKRVALAESRTLQVEASVRGAFASALHAAMAEEVLEEAMRDAEAGAKIAKALRDAGDARDDEVARAELAVVRARIERDHGKAASAKAKRALAASMGRAGFEVRKLAGSLEESMALGAVEDVLAKLEVHPAMKAASHEQDAAAALVELADRMRIPDVSVELMYRRYHKADEDTVDVGIGVEVPLLDGGSGRRRAARAEESAAAARKAATREELRARLMEAHAALARALAAAKVLKEEVVPAAKRVLDAVEARHRAGDVGLAEVLAVRREWSDARLEYLKELREVAVAWAEMRALTTNY